MFVLCVLYSKDNRQKQDKEVVQMKHREEGGKEKEKKKKNPGCIDACLLHVLYVSLRRADHLHREVLPTSVSLT
jgi:hypothetical protein